ncbi:MAG: aminoacetone oxidase family FAD-binding enzyme [bacterium]|nr:aminoacetone oxidase family FAD-binding enzyme [bacterium]
MKTPLKHYDVIVVGGGAAGMLAAGVAAARKKHVLLIEKNASLGEKLKISGGGRCNITNAEYNPRLFLQNYGQAEKFLYSSFSQFGVPDTFTFFESRGLPLVVQARNRVFPKTERAYDVFKTLKRNCEKMGVEVRTGCTVKKILHSKTRVTGVVTSEGVCEAKSFILATGGISHPETGSTGDGLQWLKDLGHTVKAPTPTIVPLHVADAWVKSLAGVSLSFMRITFFCEGKKQFSKLGKVLFAHFGLSGPLILNCASEVADLLQNGRVTATIDAFPDTDLGSLEKQIIKIFNANKNKTLGTVFKLIVPDGTAKGIVTLLPDIDFNVKVHSVTKESRKRIVDLLKALPVTITNLMGLDRAVVADGGIALPEIDQRTMRSKLFSNLYIIGDLLHINRPSGGFSLQLCWTTGAAAGNAV